MIKFVQPVPTFTFVIDQLHIFFLRLDQFDETKDLRSLLLHYKYFIISSELRETCFSGSLTFNMVEEVINLSWNSFKTSTTNAFKNLEEDSHFTDVTLACVGGHQLKAHKVILSSCSPFFKDILEKNPHQHPLIYLNNVDIGHLKNLVKFIYSGEVQVANEGLAEFLDTATILDIEGLKPRQDSTVKETVTEADNKKPEKEYGILIKVPEVQDAESKSSKKSKRQKLKTKIEELKIKSKSVDIFNVENMETEIEMMNQPTEQTFHEWTKIEVEESTDVMDVNEEQGTTENNEIHSTQKITSFSDDSLNPFKLTVKTEELHITEENEKESDERNTQNESMDDEYRADTVWGDYKDIAEDDDVDVDETVEDDFTTENMDDAVDQANASEEDQADFSLEDGEDDKTEEDINPQEYIDSQEDIKSQDEVKTEDEFKVEEDAIDEDYQKNSSDNQPQSLQYAPELEPWNVIENNSSNCDVCFKTFANNYVMVEHKRAIHEGIRFTCEHCDHIASSKRNLRSHMGYKHPEKSLPTTYNAVKMEGRGGEREEKLKQINSTKIPPKISENSTKIPPKIPEKKQTKPKQTKAFSFSSLAELNKELGLTMKSANIDVDVVPQPEEEKDSDQKIEEEADIRWLCPHCAHTSHNTELLLEHLGNNHPGKRVPTSFMSVKAEESRSNLKIQIEPNHIDIEGSSQVAKAPLSELEDSELEEKLDSITGKRNNLWVCLECGKNDRNKLALRRHAETHIRGFSHPCPDCPSKQGYKTRASLKEHRLRVHRDTPAVPKLIPSLACDMCDAVASSPGALKMHIYRMHRDV